MKIAVSHFSFGKYIALLSALVGGIFSCVGVVHAGAVANALVLKIESYEADVVFVYLDTTINTPATCGVYTASPAYKRFAIRPSEPYGMVMFSMARTAFASGRHVDITGRGEFVGNSSMTACNVWADTETAASVFLKN